jgi:hypothetical protein
MLFSILVSTSLGVWATIDMLASDESSDWPNDDSGSKQNDIAQAESQS